MFESTQYKGSLTDQYDLLVRQLHALLEGETDTTANLSNASALLNQFLDDVNWVGFYVWKEEELLLGPFQGLPACVHIAYGKGVCGTAVKEEKTQRVEDVHAFPGHIACDAASRSEIVVPLFKNGSIFGVLDIDSPRTGRFSEEDQQGIEAFANALQHHL
ncbi:GAF domain-containing protein [Alkalicoccus urumqiensis]|uniref:GAF domain-containing protein n=1 Tax=Alkalicoccus urumqiensis TaxID=1548213 RepID=A0A2P6MD90_ALKUR|nr:GAF domain-containing protein [Alkalicoccus urumqiensis]PRO64246.1 GAF domain-containing protein [Alkalicoccus urumqiensis]